MFKIFIFLFFWFSFSVFGIDLNESYNATIEGDPSALIDGCASAITGNIYLNSIDIVSAGKESFKFGRNYVNILNAPKFIDAAEHYEGRLFRTRHGGWEYLSHLYAFINYDDLERKKDRRLDIYEPSGIVQSYSFWHHKAKDKGTNLPLHKNKGSFVNTSRGAISGRTNYKNNLVYRSGEKDLKVKCVDGSIRNYKRFKSEDFPYHLDSEILPNGNIIKYKYDETLLKGKRKEYYLDLPIKIEILSPTGKVLSSLEITNFAKDKIKKNKKNYNQLFIKTNVQKKITYKTELFTPKDIYHCFLLKRVESDYGAEEIDYDNYHTYYLREYKFPNNRAFHFIYSSCKGSNVSFQKIKEIQIATKPGIFETLHTFEYKEAYTIVRDFKGNITKYFYDKDKLRLSKIERFDNTLLKNTEHFIWGSSNQDGFLLGKVIYDEKNIPIKAEKNIYDQKGNIVEKIIYGIITNENTTPMEIGSDGLPKNNKADVYITKYKYLDNDLLLSEIEPNGLITELTYHSCLLKTINEAFATDLPSSKLLKFNDKILQRTFYEYDDDNILIKEIFDDGSSKDKNDLTNVTKRLIKVITPRQIEPFGLTDTLEERYLDLQSNEEKLIKKEKYEYSKTFKVIKKEVFGSDNKLKYILNYNYDDKEHLIYETDPLGREAIYEYDENDNKIKEKDFFGNVIDFRYDNCNRLIEKIINSDDKLVEKYGYDLKNNKILEIDIYGNEKRYEYDAFNSLTKEIFPNVLDTFGNNKTPIKSYKYDALGREIEKIDAQFNTTKIKYNIFNKPILIEHPDATSEEFIYNLDGTLKKHINQEGTITEYKYDHLKRVTSKKIVSSDLFQLQEELFKYDAFNIILKIDRDGNITKYSYDGASRKIKEEVFSKDNKLLFIEELFYDELGFINKKIEGYKLATIYIRDNLGRVIEERKEKVLDENFSKKIYLATNDDGDTLYKIRYEYDEAGNKNSIISYIAGKESIEKRYYDVFNRLIKTIDPLNNITTIEYNFYKNSLNQKVLQKVVKNPLHQQTITTYDALNLEKTIEKQNSQNVTISFEEKFYDLNGNLTRELSFIYNPDSSITEVETQWQFDNMNRLIFLKEAYGSQDEKITQYSYTKTGNLKIITKPDGIKLINDYDAYGNKIRVYSSKKDIDYVFHYNNLNQLIEVIDNINNNKTTRGYDALGNLLKEIQPSGLIIKNEYDLLKNRVKTIYPDFSSVEYIYDPINLKQVIKKDKDGTLLYKHEFLKYDLSGNLLKENLILNAGTIDYELDLLGKVTSIKTSYHIQEATYDEIGRISKISYTGFLNDLSKYSYDDLNQIISEEGLFSNSYECDSHYNRHKKNKERYNINKLNEIISIDKSDEENLSNLPKTFLEFEYDKNGNPILKKTQNEEIKYYYDSLDRLIKIEKPNVYILEFNYDAFNRRIFKKVFRYLEGYIYSSWEEDISYFLYDDQNEIGSFDQNLNQKELRILADIKTAEIGSAISFEIAGYFYAPIYDISGNLISLIYKSSLYEHYRYSAFGERKIYSGSGYEKQASQIKNPWQFSSKRVDEETGLIYFGRRYYDPSLGRWLTPDPKGFADSLNLYAFVLNDPLIKVDLYGLEAFIASMNNPIIAKTHFYPKIPSHVFDLGREEISPNKRIYFSNGIDNTKREAEASAKYLSGMINNKNIHVIYNEHINKVFDFCRAVVSFDTFRRTPAAKLTADEWIEYLKRDIKNEILHICHSEGVINARNILLYIPDEYRKRIEILCFAPGAFISQESAKKVTHYVCKGDRVPKFDRKGFIENRDSVVILDPSKYEDKDVHRFNHPVYKKDLQDTMQDFINRN